VFSGRMPNQPLMEIMELPTEVHPYFVGGQFHPEFMSRPGLPAPLFDGFVQAMLQRRQTRADAAVAPLRR
jgi:CTP synthase